MLEIRDLTLAYGDKKVIEGFSMRAKPGDRIRILGESGSGKTTLFQGVAGLLAPSAGEIHRDGAVAYLFQEARLLPWMSARENVEFVLPAGADKDIAARYLREMELGEDMEKRPGELSGGMCRRVSLARALAYAEAAEAEILLLDEPFTGIDEERKARLYDVVLKACEGRILLVSTHDGAEAAALCANEISLTRP